VDAFSVFVGALLARLDYEMRQTHCANAVIAVALAASYPGDEKPVSSRNNSIQSSIGFFRNVFHEA